MGKQNFSYNDMVQPKPLSKSTLRLSEPNREQNWPREYSMMEQKTLDKTIMRASEAVLIKVLAV